MNDTAERDIAQDGLIFGASPLDLQDVSTVNLRERLRAAEASGLHQAANVLRRVLPARPHI